MVGRTVPRCRLGQTMAGWLGAGCGVSSSAATLVSKIVALVTAGAAPDQGPELGFWTKCSVGFASAVDRRRPPQQHFVLRSPSSHVAVRGRGPRERSADRLSRLSLDYGRLNGRGQRQPGICLHRAKNRGGRNGVSARERAGSGGPRSRSPAEQSHPTL